MKNSFNIGLVNIESCTISKNNICDNIFWPPYGAFTYTSWNMMFQMTQKSPKTIDQ
jgi:hypothetical protein